MSKTSRQKLTDELDTRRELYFAIAQKINADEFEVEAMRLVLLAQEKRDSNDEEVIAELIKASPDDIRCTFEEAVDEAICELIAPELFGE